MPCELTERCTGSLVAGASVGFCTTGGLGTTVGFGAVVGLGLTVTVQLALTPSTEAVTTAVPTFRAVIFPELLTVAT